MSQLLPMAKMIAIVLPVSTCLILSGCGAEPDVADPAASETAGSGDFDSIPTPPATGPSKAPTGDAPLAGEVAPRPPAFPTAPGQEPATPPEDPKMTQSPPGEAGKPAPPEIEINPANEQTAKAPAKPRTTIVGNWDFVLCDFGIDILGMLLNIKEEGDELRVSIVEDTDMMPDWTVSSAKLTPTTAHIVFARADQGEVDFRGELSDDGILRGSVAFGGSGLNLVRCMPTDRESLQRATLQQRSVNAELMQGFSPDPDNPWAELKAKAEELGDSAMSYQLYSRVCGAYRGEKPDESAFEGLPEGYIAAAEAWGERPVMRAHSDIAFTMAICGYTPAQAREHLATAEKLAGEDAGEVLTDLMQMTNGLILMASDDAAEQSEGEAILKQIRNDDPANVEATVGLADFYDRTDQTEDALQLYAELAAVPSGVGDMGPVVRLWKKLDRDPKELDAYLDEIYKSRVHEFAAASSDAPRAEANQQVVLGEMFTGVTCPPCVASDIATGALQITYPSTDFIMLRYHEHVPGPDPLTIEAGERRAGYYRIQGTPALYLNGERAMVANMFGSYFDAEEEYAALREIVDGMLTQTSDVSIELTATRNGDEIAIAATVSGAETIPETWRLRICVAEDEIAFPAMNGIRMHEMVVRAMPGGAEGTAAADGKLAFEGTVSVDEMRTTIQEYLSSIPALAAPQAHEAPLDLTHLTVVAFVQDDAAQSVLQASSVSVNPAESN